MTRAPTPRPDPDARSTTLTDAELRKMFASTRADDAAAYPWHERHGFSPEVVAVSLAKEVVHLRQLVRAFVEQDPGTKLSDDAEQFLGFNATDPATYYMGNR